MRTRLEIIDEALSKAKESDCITDMIDEQIIRQLRETVKMDYPIGGCCTLVCDHDYNILLTKRLTEHQFHKYGCPGGKIDFGEDPNDAANRELKEETGLVEHCHQLGFIANNIHIQENKHFICIWYYLQIPKQEISFIERDPHGKPKSEGWKWYSKQEFTKLPLMPSIVDAYEYYMWGGDTPTIKTYRI